MVIFNSKNGYMNIEKPLRRNILFVIIIFLLVVIGKNSNAQETDTIIPINKNPEKILRKIDTRKITQRGFNFWQDDFSGHFAGIDFGFNLFLNEDYSGFSSKFMNNDVAPSMTKLKELNWPAVIKFIF